MANPLKDLFVTSPFGKRDPVAGSNFTTGSNHSGVDLRAATGTPVYAAAAGTVEETGSGNRTWGTYVLIRSDLDKSLQRYAHLSGLSVSKGSKVKAGQQIGQAGSTGNVTGAHLHFGIMDQAGQNVDPMKWLTKINVLETTSQIQDSTMTLPEVVEVVGGVFEKVNDAKAAAQLIFGAAIILLIGAVIDDA